MKTSQHSFPLPSDPVLLGWNHVTGDIHGVCHFDEVHSIVDASSCVLCWFVLFQVAAPPPRQAQPGTQRGSSTSMRAWSAQEGKGKLQEALDDIRAVRQEEKRSEKAGVGPNPTLRCMICARMLGLCTYLDVVGWTACSKLFYSELDVKCRVQTCTQLALSAMNVHC